MLEFSNLYKDTFALKEVACCVNTLCQATLCQATFCQATWFMYIHQNHTPVFEMRTKHAGKTSLTKCIV